MIGFADAWTTPSNPRSSLTVDVSRKTFVNGVVAGVIGSAILPLPVKADVTNKVAGSTALRNLKRAQKQLSKLESVAKENDFAGVKEFLRTPPFGESRKNAFTLVRAAEDGPRMADMGNVYKAFISSIEKIDSTASLGFRGRQIPQLQLTDEYLVVQSSLEAFLKVAEEAAEIPLQYDD
eukprot:scaffold5966_cov118-Cylindrotheca_fusiformis.AAC.14